MQHIWLAVRSVGIVFLAFVVSAGFLFDFINLLPFGSNFRASLAIGESVLLPPSELRWAIFTLVYCNTLLLLGYGILIRNRRTFQGGRSYEYFSLGFCILVGLEYFCRDQNVRSHQMALLLIGGPFCGLCCRELRMFSLAPNWLYLLLGVTLAAFGAFDWPFPHIYEYRGLRRSTGLWNNPNTYGLLCGAFFNLVLGAFIKRRFYSGEHKCAMSDPRPIWLGLVELACAGLLLFGLIFSYCRGAWIGTILGVCVIIGMHMQKISDNSAPRRIPRFRLESSITVWVCTAVLFGFSIQWLCKVMDWEIALIRRLGSVANVRDLAVRNRLYAWKGAGLIVMERPLFGCGLGNIDAIYTLHYMPKGIDDPSAIHLNDYLTVAAGLGLPISLLLIGLIWSRIREGFREFDSASVAVIVLVAGAAFDGVLFRVPLALAFWILMFVEEKNALSHSKPTDGRAP